MLQCNCTPIESCTSGNNGCPSDCGFPISAAPSAAPGCLPPNWSIYDPNNCEHNLFKEQLCEITDISGFPIEYRILLPKHDYLWGEDSNSNLSYPSITKCIYAPETETSILDVFGFTADDTLQFMTIPMAIFTRDLSMMFYDIYPNGSPHTPPNTPPSGGPIFVQPQIGDVITTLWNNRHYEITSIESEQNIFLGKKFTWDMILKPFRFSEQSDDHREVHTGFPDDPFEGLVSGTYEPPIKGESENIVERNYFEDNFGDNKNVQNESDKISDPDLDAFGR